MPPCPPCPPRREGKRECPCPPSPRAPPRGGRSAPAPPSPPSACPARWRTSWPRPPRRASTASRSSSPTSSPSPLSGRRVRAALRRPRPVDRPLPALPRLRLRPTRRRRGQPAPGRAQVRRHGALGTDLVLVCSSVAPDALDDDDRIAEQLHALADRARPRGACASPTRRWPGAGTSTPTSGRGTIVRRADHPALGLCVDSFHILSRGSDPAGIRDIPGEKLFFLQLADAPHMDMDVLQWSRHHRLFPGQGAFDLPAFLGHVLAAGYTGPLSLEVFNDVFRQADPRRAGGRRPALAARAGRSDGDPTCAATRRASSWAGLPPPRPGCTASPSPSSPSTTTASPRSRARSPRSGSPTPGRTAPSRCSCGAAARRGCCSTPSRRPHGRGGRARSASRSTDPAGAARRADGAARPGAPARPRSGRGRPVRGRRTRRDVGVLLPHRRRATGWLTDFPPPTHGAASGRPASTHDRPRRADPAVRQLRRGRAVLPQPAGPGDPARVGGRGAVRPGPQPDGRRPRTDASGSA